jgi:peptidyl-dipeptidase Dcp
MKSKHLTALAVASALAIVGCGQSQESDSQKNKAQGGSTAQTRAIQKEHKAMQQVANPLMVESTLPYHAPPFDKIRPEHFLPAFEKGMEEHSQEIEAIANNPEPPTFDNTLVAMEKSGRLLSRVANVFFNLTGTISNEDIRRIEAEVSPKLSQHQDAIMLNEKLFNRVKTVYEHRDTLEDPEARRLVEVVYENFVRAGAQLGEKDKNRIRELNTELSRLTTEFSQNLLKATEQNAVLVKDKGELDGLSDDEIANLAAAAKAAGKDGYLIALNNTTRHPLLRKLKNRALRERLFKASAGRALDVNGPVIKRLVAARAEKARIFGQPDWASYKLADQMAKKPEAVFEMLDRLAPKVVQKAKAEAADIKAVMEKEGLKGDLQPWDWAFFAEKVRQQRYDLDESSIKPYFELNNVMQNGVFFAMNQLFGITFKERHDLPVYHPDVRTFEVFDADGSSIGFFYADYFAREGKRGGAWMNAIVPQSRLLGQKPVIVNVLNIPKPAEGQPALLSFDEVTTMFHEMGHAVHGLFSDVNYPTLAGTNVPRDFVEFPSQFEEDWAIDPKVIANYAKHYKTGEPIPADLLEKVLKSRKFNQGFDTLEYMEAALLDMEWHTIAAGTEVADVEAFEQQALEKHGVYYPPVPPRYKSPYFAHVFSGGYSAGYYAYLWTEVLAADAFAFMREHGGLTRENGDKFRQEILSKGYTMDPMQQYINFRGQKPSVDALLVRRGLVE